MTEETKNYLNMDLLRFSTAGSVDDGKSTLIGRLFHDTKAIFEDQLESIEKKSKQRGDENINLALLTDGLRAEREQGITIDVAYRYFATPRRKFIIADTPGHIQYTRNMVTGSTANLALILIDARNGVVEQQEGMHSSPIYSELSMWRFASIRWTGWLRRRSVWQGIAALIEFSSRLENLTELTFIPISALKGDNVVDRSKNMTWYKAPLLYHLKMFMFGSMPITLTPASLSNGSFGLIRTNTMISAGSQDESQEASSRPEMRWWSFHLVSPPKLKRFSLRIRKSTKPFIHNQ